MPAPLSIIIPTLNAAEALPGSLQSLIPGLEGGLIRELVISDGGSTDRTKALAEEAGARFVSGPAGRGGQIARGVAAARGDWVLILHADTWLAEGWPEAAGTHMDRDRDKAGYFRLRFRAAGPAPSLVAGWANLRSRHFSLPYGDQGLLVRKAVLEAIGGVPEIPLMEDVALARRLRGRLVMLPAEAHTSAERYRQEGWVKRGARNLIILARYLGGADPQTLAEAYAPGVSSSAN